jgi:hypothetical protein
LTEAFKQYQNAVSDFHTLPKRIKIGIAMLLIPLSALIVWQVAKPIEPLYKGKPLSFWLKDEYLKANVDTEKAVRHIGTNGILTLLRLLRDKDSVAKAKLMDLLQRQHVFRFEYIPPEVGHYAVAYAFGQLGTDAHITVPELVKIADENIFPTSRACAIESVGYVGLPSGEAVPALLRWATNSDPKARSWARAGLERIDPEAYRQKR